MKIILAILCALAWIILLSVKSKKPEDPIEKLRNDIDNLGLTDEEILNIIIEYQNTYSYAIYELKKAYYELGQAIRNSFKK